MTEGNISAPAAPEAPTLRDRFAMAALTHGVVHIWDDPEAVAAKCYQIADAFLVERAKP
jgi:hypothetical protein